MRRTLPLLAALLAAPAFAQTASPAAAPAAAAAPARPAQPAAFDVPPAAEADVASIDGIIAALYDVISGPAGQPRDWNRARSLFVPTARLMPVGVRADGSAGIRMGGVSDYIATTGPLLLEKGFHEREIARRTERFGHIAHVFSTYEATIGGQAEPLRGINSIQLMHDGQRWWVVSVMWEAERPGLSLPAEYLPATDGNR